MKLARLLKIAAVIVFAVAVVGLDVRVSLVALGLFLYTLAEVI